MSKERINDSSQETTADEAGSAQAANEPLDRWENEGGAIQSSEDETSSEVVSEKSTSNLSSSSTSK
ncbi:MAG: hypothetical protein IH840_13395 [Candidatus Heimdallarchaeota archaeon]|nr:hypothetical protein [Candidatus Heimdallarchaeota archaeon]